MKYIINGFSTKMLRKNKKGHLMRFYDITQQEFDEIKQEAVSAIGHYNIAELLGIPRNRFNIQLEKGDEAYIVQTTTGRNHAMDNCNYEISYQKVKILT